jgi:hypothetical protein
MRLIADADQSASAALMQVGPSSWGPRPANHLRGRAVCLGHACEMLVIFE